MLRTLTDTKLGLGLSYTCRVQRRGEERREEKRRGEERRGEERRGEET